MDAIEAMKALLNGKRIKEKGKAAPYMEIVNGTLVGEFGGGGSILWGAEYEEVDVMEEVARLKSKGALLLDELEKINLKIQALEERRK